VSPETKARVVALAKAEAEQYFPLQVESTVPDLLPEESWSVLNEEFPENAKEPQLAPTEMDRLFERTFIHEMAKRWAAHTATEGPRELSDPELAALTTLVNSDLQGERHDVSRYGELQCAPDLRARQALDAELTRRGIITPWPGGKP
jgi:hypothetical protein